MKQLVIAFMLFGLMAARPADAEYMGKLQKALPYTFEVVSSLPVAVTVLTIDKRGRLEAEQVLVLEAANGVQTWTIPPAAERMLFVVSGNRGDSYVVKIAQATMRLEVQASPDAHITVDAF